MKGFLPRRHHNLVRVHDRFEDARAAVEELLARGVPKEDVGMVAHEHTTALAGLHEELPDGVQRDDFSDRATHDAGKGALVGGVLGAPAGLALPGIGLAIGSLAAVFATAGAGAVTAGVLTGISAHIVEEPEASRYADAFRRGATIVAVHGPSATEEVAALLDRHGPVELVGVDVPPPPERTPMSQMP